MHLGGFETAREAAIAYDRAALYYLGERARLNFPDIKLEPAPAQTLRRRPAKKRKRHSEEADGLIGVVRFISGDKERWLANITVDRAWLNLGSWDTAEEAALAYDRATLHYRPQSEWKLNFPKLARGLGAADADTLAGEARATFKERTTSRFRGVWWCAHHRAWLARFTLNKQSYSFGPFRDEESAARAYDRAALRKLGTDARLNFHPVTGKELLGKRVPHADEPRQKSDKRAKR